MEKCEICGEPMPAGEEMFKYHGYSGPCPKPLLGRVIEEGPAVAKNTDRELWRERNGDYYAPSLFVTEGGGIGMNVGGTVIVRPVREWHKLALSLLSTQMEQICHCGKDGQNSVNCPVHGTWRPITGHPTDRQFLATLRVYSNSTGKFSHWDTHVIAIDENTGEPVEDQGWSIDDYEYWCEIPAYPPDEMPQASQ